MAFGALVAGGVQVGVAAASHEMGKKEAAVTRQWQKMMSDTAIRRSVADMKAAGLNPLLAINAGGGASSPPGAMAQAPNMAGVGSAMGGGAEIQKYRDGGKYLLDQQGWKTKDERTEIAGKVNLLKSQTRGQQIHNEIELTKVPGAKIEAEIDKHTWGGRAPRWLQRWNPLRGRWGTK